MGWYIRPVSPAEEAELLDADDAPPGWRDRVVNMGETMPEMYVALANDDGDATAATFGIEGGVEFGPDVGFGPLRYIAPDLVKKVAAELGRTEEEEFALRFVLRDDTGAAEIPGHVNGLVGRYRDFRQCYLDAARNGDGMAIVIY
jgi:hypothetical protein